VYVKKEKGKAKKKGEGTNDQKEKKDLVYQ